MLDRILVISLAFLLDLIIGDPHFLWHPVRAIGFLISSLERMLRKCLGIRDERALDKTKKRVAGVILTVLVIGISVAASMLILYLAGRIGRYFRLGVEVVMCYQLLAVKALRVESMKVYKALKTKGIEEARHAVSMIVGRDTAGLDETGVTKAAVETIAENTSDGITAPLIFMALFGAPGGFFYKSINTLDSMIGYKNDKYRYMGSFAAHLDDVVNFIPARISAVFMILAAYILPSMNGANAIKIYRRDRKKHASPNSAHTEAVCAGALKVCLAGNAYYFGRLYEKPTIGDALRDIEAEDIKRTNRLMYATAIITLFACVGVLFAVHLIKIMYM